MNKIKLYITVFTVVVILANCSSLGPKVVEKSGSKEEWVKFGDIYFEKEDTLYFKGEVSGVYDLALGKRQAEADAKKRLVEAVSSEITSEYREFARGSNTIPGDVGRFIEDGIEAISRNVKISGLLAEKSYWERLMDNPDEEGSKPYYRIFALLKIVKKDYNAAKGQVISGLMEKAKQDRNKEAEQVIEEWKMQRKGD